MRHSNITIGVIAIISTVIFGACNSKKIEGVFIYTELPKKTAKKDQLFADAFEVGRELGCALLGSFEFKNGRCYYKVMGAAYRADYDIDDGMIYLKNNPLDNAGLGIEILDANTLSYGGCLFKRIPDAFWPAYVVEELSLRIEPDSKSEKWGTLERGTKVYALEETGEWMKIRAGSKEGFVLKKFLADSIVAEPQKPQRRKRPKLPTIEEEEVGGTYDNKALYVSPDSVSDN